MIRTSLCIFLAFVMAAWTPAIYAIGPCFNGVCEQQFVQQQFVQPQFVEEFNVVERVDILQKRVEFDAEYFLGLDGYYDVVNNLQEQEYVKDKDIILKQAEQIDRLINLLEQALRLQQLNNGVKPVTPVEPEPEEPKTEIPSNPDSGALLELDSRVFVIFSAKCASCHGTETPKAGLRLVGTDTDGTKWLNNLSLDDRVLVYDHTAGIKLKERGKKLMPLGKEPLPDSEVDTLRLWMIAKAEEIKRGKNND